MSQLDPLLQYREQPQSRCGRGTEGDFLLLTQSQTSFDNIATADVSSMSNFSHRFLSDLSIENQAKQHSQKMCQPEKGTIAIRCQGLAKRQNICPCSLSTSSFVILPFSGCDSVQIRASTLCHIIICSFLKSD